VPNVASEALRIEVARRKVEREHLAKVLTGIVEPSADGWVSSLRLTRLLVQHVGYKPKLDAVAAVLTEMGGFYSRQADKRQHRGWKGIAVKQGTRRIQQELIKAWNARLKAEDMPQEMPLIPESLKVSPGSSPNGSSLSRRVEQVHARRSRAEARFATARRYLWETDWTSIPAERAIWALYATEGASVREIEEELGTYRDNVQKVLTKHRARAGILGI
jgi:hypothetical protein